MNSENLEDIVYGRHPAEALLKSSASKIDRIWLQQDIHFPDSFRTALFAMKRHGVKLNFVDRKTLDRLSGGGVHQGIVIRVSVCLPLDYNELVEGLDTCPNAFLLMLDHLQDPRNLGAVFRSAAAAQINGILLPRHGSAPLSASAMKASAGTLTEVPVSLVGNLASTLRDLKQRNYWVVGISHDSSLTLDSSGFPARVVCVVGGEDTGLRPVVRKECDEIRSIPMRGPAGSLNVSVATGIVLYEWIRSNSCSPR